MIGSRFLKKAIEPIRAQLVQGVDPKRLALACTAGVLIGLFPILGATTTLCVVIGVLFSLNHAVLQSVNYLLYPLQLLALPFFLKAGTRVFGGQEIEFDLAKWKTEIASSFLGFLEKYGLYGLKAVGVWMLVAAVLGFPLFFIFYRLFRKMRVQKEKTP